MDLFKFYEENNFKVDKKFAYGIYRDRVMSFVFSGSYMKVTISFNILPNQQQGQALSLKIREIKQTHRALQNGMTTNVAQELIIYKSADFEKEFFEVLDLCLDAIDEIVPASVDTCPLCGKVMPSNSPFIKIKNAAVQAHDGCVEQLFNATNQMGKSMAISTKKNVWKTILICLLSMIVIVGLIAASALINIYDFTVLLSGWLLFLIVKFLMFKFKVAAKKPELIVLTIFSVLTVILSIYFGSSIDMYISLNSLTYLEVLNNYFKIFAINFTNYGVWIIFDLILALAFVGSTIFFNFKQLSGGTQNIKKL